MAESIKHKMEEAGHKAGEAVEKAAHWAKDKASQVFGSGGSSHPAIAEHMDVIGSCGMTLGRVDHVEGDEIKLTKSDSPDGRHHLIPMAWVSRVDQHVHLSKSCGEAQAEWQDA